MKISKKVFKNETQKEPCAQLVSNEVRNKVGEYSNNEEPLDRLEH